MFNSLNEAVVDGLKQHAKNVLCEKGATDKQIAFFEGLDNRGILSVTFGTPPNPIKQKITNMFLQQSLFEYFINADISEPVRNLLIVELADLSLVQEATAPPIPNTHNIGVKMQSIGDQIGDKIDMLKQGLRDHWKGISDFYNSHRGVIDVAALAAVAYGAYKLAKYLYKKSHPDATPEQVDNVAKQAQIKELRKVMASCSRSQDPEQCRKKVQERINKIQKG